MSDRTRNKTRLKLHYNVLDQTTGSFRSDYGADLRVSLRKLASTDWEPNRRSRSQGADSSTPLGTRPPCSSLSVAKTPWIYGAARGAYGAQGSVIFSRVLPLK